MIFDMFFLPLFYFSDVVVLNCAGSTLTFKIELYLSLKASHSTDPLRSALE